MFSIMKRNLQLYFHNKVSVFFSLMGAWIAFALYVIFLQRNMLDSWSVISHPEKTLDSWVMGGVLAVTSITTTWVGAARLTRDRESHKLDDFLLTDVSLFRLNLGYFMSASLIGIMMQVMMFVIMSLYFYWQDGLLISLASFPLLFGVILLSSFLGSSLGLLLLQFIKSVDVVERLAVIIGTASGFLVGVYMPIGSLPSFAQNVVKLTPGAYVAAAYRRVLMTDKLTNWNLPGINIKEYLGIGLKIKHLTTLNQDLLIIGGLLLLILIALVLVLSSKKKY